MGDRTSHRTDGGLETVPIQTTPEADQTTGVIPAAPWRIKALSVLPEYRLAVTFMDDTQGIADFSAILAATECGVFEALKDKTSFDQARLHLGAVTWPNGADMDPAWMYEQVRANKLWSVPF
ncbi:MAG: DUF2442 domain-containing protein [Methyloversatilis sp.]|nr:DUF2442 domain-containing protein [Methyloversatilis sp.]MBP6195632.1 DUF2442 domain-containing protein [Methyloversatilis sp.]